MRFALVTVLLLLAGCSSTAGQDGPLAPLHSGAVEPDDGVVPENVSMDPVSGHVAADGIRNTFCGSLSGGGNILTTFDPWTFKVGTNATRMAMTFEWAPTNPTTQRLTFDLHTRDGSLARVTGAPGMQQEVDVRDVPLDDRSVRLAIGMPACSAAPVEVQAYGDVRVDVAVEFLH